MAHTMQNQFVVKRSGIFGLGLYTRTPITRGGFVIEYTGKKLTQTQAANKGGRYLFEINERMVVDGSPRSNRARYINHSCKPNCCPELVRGKIYIYAKRSIGAGEELTYDYGKEYFNAFIRPHGCKCPGCADRKKKGK